jgi:DNA replication protein DnaC
MLGVKLLFNEDSRRPVTPQDFVRARLPERLWGASIDKIPANLGHRARLSAFISNIRENVDLGRNAIFSGKYGSGKTACSVVIAREIISRGGTVLFVDENTLVNSILDGKDFEEEVSYRNRSEGVTLLIIDEFGLRHNDTRASVIESIVRNRIGRTRPTVLTTNLEEPVFCKKYQPLYEALKDCCTHIECAGIDWRVLPTGGSAV